MREEHDDPLEGQQDAAIDEAVQDLLADPVLAASLDELDVEGRRPLDAAVRDRHLARIRTAGPAAPPARRPSVRRLRARRRRVAVALVGLLSLSLVAAGGTVAAAQDAAPDDGLYAVKRSSERLWLAVPRSAQGAARAELTLATRRLDEARQAPARAEELTAEGIQHATAAEEELPEDALRTFERLLGDGEGRLPDRASPRARVALHRNCVRLSERLEQDPARCGEAPEDVHPGRGRGRDGLPPGLADDHPGGRRGVGPEGQPGRGLGPPEDTDGIPRGRGFGPGGRPDDDTIPRGRGFGPGGPPDDDTAPRGRGFGPGGRPEGWVGPPPGVRPLPGDPLGDAEDGTRRPDARRPVEPPAVEGGGRTVPDLDTDPETGPPSG